MIMRLLAVVLALTGVFFAFKTGTVGRDLLEPFLNPTTEKPTIEQIDAFVLYAFWTIGIFVGTWLAWNWREKQ